MLRAVIAIIFMNLFTISANAVEPWIEPQDAAAAINDSDRYAWQLFVALNWPADISKRAPNPSKPFGAPDPVVWETWRNANNNDPETAFPLDGSDPGPWISEAPNPLAPESVRTLRAMDPEPLQQVLILNGPDAPLPFFDEDASPGGFNETRLNKQAYEFLHDNGLYNLNGQMALALRGDTTISFPMAAKEIKAQWRRIAEVDKPRYHWTTIDQGATTLIYGLTALHITTKDLPNWFWATFEHIDNKKSFADGGREGNEGWKLPSRDRAACPAAPFDCEGIPAGFGLEGTKWENYRLRGTQVDFVDSRGNALILANSQPERGFQTSSSCITCHAISTVDKDGLRQSFVSPEDTLYVGSPDPKLLEGYTQLDFVYSLQRAQLKRP